MQKGWEFQLKNINKIDGRAVNDIFELKEQLKRKVFSYGDFNFDDEQWHCYKMKRNSAQPSFYTLKFFEVPEKYKELVKFYCLLANYTIRTIQQKVRSVVLFLDYLDNNFPDYQLKHVNYKIMLHFEQYLIDEVQSETMKRHHYTAISDFFKELYEFPELPNEIPTKKKNPFLLSDFKKKNSDKYIPKSVVEQLDVVMKDNKTDIPTCFRLLYWLQRSFPNRLTEVCSIKVDCLKPFYSYYILQIPTTKQNGGYLLEEMKSIPIINNGHGKYIISLFQKMAKERENYLERHPIDNKNEQYLIVSPAFSFYEKDKKIATKFYASEYHEVIEMKRKFPNLSSNQIREKLLEQGIDVSRHMILHYLKEGVSEQYYALKPYSVPTFNKFLNKLIEICQIKDENEKLYKVSSHQFRHNSTTDRLYVGGYTLDQVRTLRNDKGENMVMQYVHQQKEYHKKTWMEATGLKSPNTAPVEFKGTIVNLEDKNVLKRLNRSPNTYLTWEANGKKGVGMCSNISGCNPKGTSVHFECYECDWFVPKAEYYDDYKKEYEYWVNIMNENANKPQRAAHFENAIRNVNILERILKICENGIEKHKSEIENKMNF